MAKKAEKLFGIPLTHFLSGTLVVSFLIIAFLGGIVISNSSKEAVDSSTVKSITSESVPTHAPTPSSGITPRTQKTQYSNTPTPVIRPDQSEYLEKARVTLARIGQNLNDLGRYKSGNPEFYSDCIEQVGELHSDGVYSWEQYNEEMDRCKRQTESLNKIADPFIDYDKQNQEYLIKIISFIERDGVLSQESKDAINRIYDYYD